jgi:hypothetical protein
VFNRMISSIFNSKTLWPWFLIFSGFLILEIVLRFAFFGSSGVLQWNQYSPRSIVYLDYTEKVSDPVLKWKLKPNISGYIKGVEFKTNSEGFRDDEFTKENQIVVLGRSITLGEGVSFDDIWPQQLEKKLIDGNHGLNDVQNMAVSAYSLVQVERSFDLYGRKRNPKLVIMPIFIEEWDLPIVPENYTQDFSIGERFGLRHQLTRFFSFFAISQWQRQLFSPWLNASWSTLGNEKLKDYPSLQTELARIVFSLKQSSDRVVLVNLPAKEKISSATRAKTLGILTDWLDRQSFIDWIDASDVVSGHVPYPTIFYGDPHPNKDIHKKIAEKIYLELNSKNRLN